MSDGDVTQGIPFFVVDSIVNVEDGRSEYVISLMTATTFSLQTL